jgi:dTDP-4-dehydrorhamnose reductase
MMRILLFGKHGQVGKALAPLLHPLSDIISMGLEDLDVADSNKLRDVLRLHKPNVVINASAYTNVDWAEIEKETAWKVNADAPGIMMEELNRWKGTLIHFSTDYVFDGTKRSPYIEDDALNPINEYGRSKLGGERLVQAKGDKYLILRTSWVYAEDSQNFVSNVLKWSTTQETIRIVDDQIGSPTSAKMLAEQTAGLLMRKEMDDFIKANAGVYHCAGKGEVSRYDFAKKILSFVSSRAKVKATTVIPAKSSDFSSLASRPSYSALDCTKFEKTFDVNLPTWDASLFDALQRFNI